MITNNGKLPYYYNATILYKIYLLYLLHKIEPLVLAWDIETHTMRGLEFFLWQMQRRHHYLLEWRRAIKTNLSCRYRDDIESELDYSRLKASALCWRALAPDIKITYNGSKYDCDPVENLRLDVYANVRHIDSILRWNIMADLLIT